MASNPLKLEKADHVEFFMFNLPLQVWRKDDGRTCFLTYMPRRQECAFIDAGHRDEPALYRNTARVLRNLADLFDAKARGEIDHIYYPDETLKEAIRYAKKERAEAAREDKKR